MSKLETNTIDNISGSSTLKIGDTNATTLDFDTGITSVTNIPSALTNTPAFQVRNTVQQTIPNTTFTKMEFNTEDYDTDSAFASNKFTVPSGKAGKYYFQVTTEMTGIDDAEYVQVLFYKNGSSQAGTTARWYSPGGSLDVRARTDVILTLAVDDYIEAYVYQNEGANKATSTSETFFRGFRLIGV